MLFDHVVAKQGGVVRLAQAVECGVSARTVQRHARDGTWERLHPAVYLVGGHDLDDRGRVRAAGLWAGERSTITGPAAAFWFGMLPDAPDVIDLTVPVGDKPRPQPDLRIRRRDLHSTDRVKSDGVWVTGRALTALDTAVAQPDGSVFLDRALQKWVRFPTLYRAYCRNVGRTGSSRAGELIRASADRAESAAERLLVALLREAGITGWVLGHPFGAHRIDLAFPAARVAIEVDGWAWHVDAVRFRADRRKGNVIARAAGWDLLRFTWHDLDSRPYEVVAEIRETLALAVIAGTGT
ncbi:MAG: type IV toxin-antitoxin system AbiEi family antitoxin domain-containing protein [Pseudonocardia sp.]|nr:type IV toxin-antitoxin system AbiEi family antitoxin domain-containing protein [Pseudonocardia sp.]